MNIAMLLQMAAETVPERHALTSHHLHYTYEDLYRAATVAAAQIRDSGCA